MGSTGSNRISQGPNDQIPAKADVLGMPIAQVWLSELLEYIRAAISAPDSPRLIAYANAHGCNLFVEDAAYRQALLEVDLIYADGNGPRLAAWIGGSWLPPRMTGADWVFDLCQLCEREGFGMYFLGSSPGVAETAADRLRAQFPELRILGTQHGFFHRDDELQVIRSIEQAKPDILVVGMGSPRQEIWMTQHKDAMQVPVIWGAGGVFDYTSGTIRRAPRWMRKLALEWLGRALLEPRRLAPRYMIGIPTFLVRAVRHGLTRRWQQSQRQAELQLTAKVGSGKEAHQYSGDEPSPMERKPDVESHSL